MNLTPEKRKTSWQMRSLFVLVGFLMLSVVAMAQKIDVNGTIKDAVDGTPLIGATVMQTGTSNGTVTNVDGRFSLSNVSLGDSLTVSYVGYQTKTVVVNSGTMDVALPLSTQSIDEVVVTALGIEREEKTLGYAVEEVSGDDLAEAREANLVNSLNGKLAGVHIANGNSGAGSSARITIRGESSIAGNNQPLFVVDGIPINNNTDTRSNSSIADNMELDYGNGAAEISPEDIESISVLKGPNAAALYGSRAANGVVLITTKSGKGTKGFGVTVNSTTTFETLLAYPEYQTKYGQGKNGDFSFVDGYGSGTFDGVDESWGPALDGRMIAQFDSPTENGLRGGDVHGLSYTLGSSGVDLDRRGAVTATPWTHHGDPVEQFFQTGVTLTNNVSFYGSSDMGNFRFSYTNFDNKGIVPNTDLMRNTFNVSGEYNLTDKLSISTNVNYIKANSGHRHANSYGTESVMYLWTWYGMQINTDNLKDYWQEGLEGFQQFNYNYNYHDNPYFNVYENTNALDKDRIIGNVALNYDITNSLSLLLRAGTDYFNETRTIQRAYSTQRFPNGQYREDKIRFREINTDFLLKYAKKLSLDWDVVASVGGNIMYQSDYFNGVSNNKLVIPEVYTFENTDIALQSDLYRGEKQINSLYGFGQVGYKEMIFLDVTARNDWSSTLPVDNNSYFYPSVTTSFVLNEMFDMPSAISFAKLRAGWAQVGNDTDPYATSDFYTFGVPFGDNLTAYESSTIANTDLKPEIKTSFESGFDLRFLKDRLGVDFTYYNEETRNQIMAIELSRTTGYQSKFINAGKISNQGIELMLNAIPVQTQKGFSWGIDYTFSRNINEVVELTEGIDEYVLTSNRITLIARPGEKLGNMYGTGFVTNDDNEIIWNNGLPEKDNTLLLLGNYNPDFIMGLNNTFRYKNLSFSFLFDWKEGGELMSLFRLIGATAGNAAETVKGRETGMIGNGVKEVNTYDNNGNVVMQDGEPVTQFVQNDVVVEASAYHNIRYKRGNEQQGMYDATYVKLREVRLGYTLPSNLYKNSFLGFVGDIKLSFVGRNLMLWTHFNHGDPETVSFNSGGDVIPGVEDMSLPSTRSFGFNVNVKF
jgi:TonB-linked SusC/RagA family outer membrane protein